ncbi:hypothetical protein F5B18DRAFT_657526 [Nemania serpens]|nr:hypothetical protein F5B18DRAFT_657526 [Nemania serpens]
MCAVPAIINDDKTTGLDCWARRRILAEDTSRSFPLAVEGVNYAALISTNSLRADQMRPCPKSHIVAGGYSQVGAANHGAIEGLSQNVKDKIKGSSFSVISRSFAAATRFSASLPRKPSSYGLVP